MLVLDNVYTQLLPQLRSQLLMLLLPVLGGAAAETCGGTQASMNCETWINKINF